MNIRDAYDTWASQYDTVDYKTRDLEGFALRKVLGAVPFDNCLEIGCGTGKNTVWFVERCSSVTAVDLSEEMLCRAKEKTSSPKVRFLQADITKPWPFQNDLFSLVSFSLVLEHIAALEPVFTEAFRSLKSGGYLYLGELHPFKQYTGTKARFNTKTGTHIVECYTHHVSEFLQLGKKLGLSIIDVNEYFDGDDSGTVPRILTVLFKKP